MMPLSAQRSPSESTSHRSRRFGFSGRCVCLEGLIPGILVACICLTTSRACGDDKDPSAQAAVVRFNAIADREAQSLRLSYADDASNPFELVPRPLLVWTNPVSGSIRGRVYLWTHHGVPVLVASIYKYDEQTHVSSECHALARRPIAGKSAGGEDWTIDSASIEFKPVPSASAPGATRTARLVQMRDVARRFAATRTDPDKSNWDLRLLAQPLYRYPESAGDKGDGAVFAFVQGTNPDVILIIETGTSSGDSEWKYSVVRMHRYELKVELDSAPIQAFPSLSSQQILDRSKPYCVFRTQLPVMGN